MTIQFITEYLDNKIAENENYIVKINKKTVENKKLVC